MADDETQASPARHQPPPSQQEILWDWFLTEIQDATQRLESLHAEVEQERVSLSEASTTMRATIEAMQREAVGLQRGIKRSVEDVKTALGRQRPEDMRSVVRDAGRQTAVLAAIASTAGAIIGGVVVSLVLQFVA